MHPMLTDPALAHLPFRVYAEPAPWPVDVTVAVAGGVSRPCPPWRKCHACRGDGNCHCPLCSNTPFERPFACAFCRGSGVLDAATGEPL